MLGGLENQTMMRTADKRTDNLQVFIPGHDLDKTEVRGTFGGAGVQEACSVVGLDPEYIIISTTPQSALACPALEVG